MLYITQFPLEYWNCIQLGTFHYTVHSRFKLYGTKVSRYSTLYIQHYIWAPALYVCIFYVEYCSLQYILQQRLALNAYIKHTHTQHTALKAECWDCWGLLDTGLLPLPRPSGQLNHAFQKWALDLPFPLSSKRRFQDPHYGYFLNPTCLFFMKCRYH